MHEQVKAKKHLGQHFLTDEGIALDIVKSLQMHNGAKTVLEIGPGMGVLTKYLLEDTNFNTFVIDIDTESIEYLSRKFPALSGRIISGDFLKFPLDKIFSEPFVIIGNFPYNISSQIMFKVLEHKDQITEVVGMFQKEVAERIASPAGNRDYGILSVFLQAYYDIEYLFTVPEHVFNPPPKVKSGVIRLKRNQNKKLECDEKLFISVVKMAFNQRRKTLRNALRAMVGDNTVSFLSSRAEQLSYQDFVQLTNEIARLQKK